MVKDTCLGLEKQVAQYTQEVAKSCNNNMNMT